MEDSIKYPKNMINIKNILIYIIADGMNSEKIVLPKNQ